MHERKKDLTFPQEFGLIQNMHRLNIKNSR